MIIRNYACVQKYIDFETDDRKPMTEAAQNLSLTVIFIRL